MSEQRDEARRWLAYAEGDLTDAEALLERGRWRNAAYLAQQAGEKAVKAVLVARAIHFQRTHDIATLVALAPPASAVRRADADVDALSAWSVEARYPTDVVEPSPEEARKAIADARRLLQATTQDLQEGEA
jgi:HEPN domain-containing protein